MLLMRLPALYPPPGSQKGKNTRHKPPPQNMIFPPHITQAVISFTGINAVHNNAESADLRQTTKIVIAGGRWACVRACVRDELGKTLLFHRESWLRRQKGMMMSAVHLQKGNRTERWRINGARMTKPFFFLPRTCSHINIPHTGVLSPGAAAHRPRQVEDRRALIILPRKLDKITCICGCGKRTLLSAASNGAN